MKKKVLFLLFFVLSTSISSAQLFEIFTAYEGLDKARETAKSKGITSPVLIGVGWMNIKQSMGAAGVLVGEIKLEGNDIGKANLWIYNFKSNDEAKPVLSIGVAKMTIMGSFYGMVLPGSYFESSLEQEVVLTKETDSPVFIEKLTSSTDFINKIPEDTGNEEDDESIVSFLLQAVTAEDIIDSRLNLTPEVPYWIALTSDMYADEIDYCYIELSELKTGNIICNHISSIDAKEEVFEISLAPNPATTRLNIIAPSDLNITSIELFNIKGASLGTFAASTRDIDVSGLPIGNYYLCVSSETKKYYTSFVVVK